MIAPSTTLLLKIMTGYGQVIPFASILSYRYDLKILKSLPFHVEVLFLQVTTWFYLLYSISEIDSYAQFQQMGKSGIVNRVEPSTVDQGNEVVQRILQGSEFYSFLQKFSRENSGVSMSFSQSLMVSRSV